MNSDHQGAGFPKPVGPYSIFREAEGWIFLSGQIGLDPSTGKIVEGGVEAETRRILSNMEGIFLQAGIGWENCLKMTIYLVDMQDFEKVNEVYGRTLREPFPARSTVGVSALPKGARIEMEAIARKSAP